jgi:hypothetical protein
MKSGGRKFGFVDWLLVFALVSIVLVMLVLLTGCTQAKQVQDTEIIWHDGSCFLFVKNMSIEQAKEMQKSIKFENCKVIFDDDLTEGEPK